MEAQLSTGYTRTISLRVTVALFGAAFFTSAFLLFWLQPLIGKMLLPLLGGAPSVWNTCMVFFQALLLAGYAYALLISQRLRLRNQAFVHIFLVLTAGLFLPFAISSRMIESLPVDSNPTLWLLSALLMTVGFPFFVLSATAPLLQKWFSHSSHTSANDPYFLYAVSNTGSMLSLLAFPFILEPILSLWSQSRYWALGYVLLAILICCCALILRDKASPRTDFAVETKQPERLGAGKRLEWISLAFIPSSLMLGITTYISTDVASVPLIWIIPLSLYLLTFVLAFANKQLIRLRFASLLLPAAIVCLGFFIILKPPVSVWLTIGLHLAVFFLVGFICHRRLAEGRPSVSRLAEYYLWISVGGVLGGIMNALVAPIIFSMPLEYPLIVVAACLMRIESGRVLWSKAWLKVGFPSFLLLLTVGLSYFVPRLGFKPKLADGLVLCLPLLLAYLITSRHRFVFALSLSAVMIGGYPYLNAGENVLMTKRNFFGVWRVSSDSDGGYHRLKHGSTAHGGQYLDPERKCNATAYYHKDGPLGQVFDAFNGQDNFKRIAAVGLGAGTVAGYSTTDQAWDFYEIDPAIVQIAEDKRFFTFLTECSAAPYNMILGDARLRLREAPPNHYELIILDAFSSDSVPAHLLTTQAMDLYLSKLAPEGLIAFHISNRYLNLEPLVAGLSNEKGVSALVRQDPKFDGEQGKYPSTWVILARTDSILAEISSDTRWRRLNGNVVWTDDFSNILSLMKH